MSKVSVLITGAGTATCQSVIKGLRAQGKHAIRIVTADSNEQNAGRYLSDAFYQIPLAKEENFIQSILEICKKEAVRLLVPIVDWEFNKFAQARNEFEKIGCAVAISDPAVIDLCDDKWKTYQFFMQHHIPAPATYLPETFANAPFPVFVKPRTMGRASLDTYVVQNAEALKSILAAVPNPLIQDYIRGTEYTIDSLSDFEGNPVNAVIRERVEVKSGVSYKGRTVKNDKMLEQAIHILRKLPIRGPANIQCFKTGDAIIFIEINPRFSGGLALSLAAGFNSPLLLVEMALGVKVAPQIGNYKAGVSMYRYWQEIFTDGNGDQLPSFH